MRVKLTGATLAVAATTAIAAAAAVKQRRAGSASQYDDDDFDSGDYVASRMRAKGIRDEGQNADWIDSAYRVGTTPEGYTLWLVDGDDYGWSLMIRFYMEDEDEYVDEHGKPMPQEYAEEADGYNDVIVTVEDMLEIDSPEEADEMLDYVFNYKG